MIANTFIKRPVTAIVISIILMISGILCIANLAVDQYPNITPPAVSISGQYTGADAQTVEQTVATPIEEQVNGTPGMEYMQSTNTNTGSMGITVTFNVGTNVHIAALNVQNRVGIATPLLPSVVSRLGLTVRARNPSMLMQVAVFSPKGTHNITFLDNYTNVFIEDALLRVPGVGDVYTRTDNFSMRVWMNPEKMAAYGLVPQDIISALNAQNVQTAAGSAGAPPQQNTQTFELGILVNGPLNKVSDFENIVVKTIPSTGELVHLKDVARVELGKFTFSSNSFVDGKRASIMFIYQTPGSNALETANNVYATLEQLKKSFPADVDYAVPFESITIIRVSMQEVIETLLKALGLVALVVFLFLQKLAFHAYPYSCHSRVDLRYLLLFHTARVYNQHTHHVRLRSRHRHCRGRCYYCGRGGAALYRQASLSAKEATYRAMKDISAPVVAIALILAAVFVPVGFIPGIVGRLYQQFAITIAISVMLSAFIALSLTPALCSLLLKPHGSNKSRWSNKIFGRFNRWFETLTNDYVHTVRRGIRASRYVVILLLCICIGAVFLFKKKPSGFIPAEDDGRLYVTYQMPEGTFYDSIGCGYYETHGNRWFHPRRESLWGHLRPEHIEFRQHV